MNARPRTVVLAGETLFTGFFPPPVIARLDQIAEWTRFGERDDSPSLRELIGGADALVTTWQSPYLLADMIDGSSVHSIVHCGGEIRARMEEAILDLVTVANTPDPMAAPVAEMAVAFILAFVRRLGHYDRAMCAGAVADPENVAEGETLAGRRVGIVGFGRIGRALARLLRPFGAELATADPYAAPEDARIRGVTILELDELLRTSSVVVLTAALTAETRGLLDRRRLALLSSGAVLVNVARGGLVDFEALLAELVSGRISAALDVTDPLDPLPPDHDLRRLPNVILTPHIAGGGLETRRAMGEAAVEELARLFRGERPRNHVTRAMLARMT